MTDSDRVKEALAALADGEPAEPTRDDRPSAGADSPSNSEIPPVDATETADYRTVIERAGRATADIEAAAEFAETVGLDELESAIDEAERAVSRLSTDGREALEAFEQYRDAARGGDG